MLHHLMSDCLRSDYVRKERARHASATRLVRLAQATEHARTVESIRAEWARLRAPSEAEVLGVHELSLI